MQKNHRVAEGSHSEAQLIDKLSNGQYRKYSDQIKDLKGRLERAVASIDGLNGASFWKKLLSKKKLAAASAQRDQIVVDLKAAEDRFKETAQAIRGSAEYKQAVMQALQKPVPPPAAVQKSIPSESVVARPRPQVNAAPPHRNRHPAFSITVRPTGSSVEHLFEASSRRGWPTPPPGSRTSENIYLPLNSAQTELVTRLGARVGPKGGVLVEPGTPLDALDQWLPFYAKKHIEPLNVDSIPGTNWGGSLANLLTSSSWQTIRKSYVESTGDKCAICGYPSPANQSVDCHEIWEYHRPKKGNVGIQRLIGIVPVCGPCHEMFHLGKAGADGRLDEVLSRLAWANRWDMAKAEEYCNYQRDKWHQRNEYMWMLDISRLQSGEDLILKGGKTGVTVDADGDLHFKAFNGPGSTRFLGARFGHKNAIWPAHPVPSYSDYVKDV